MLGEARVAIPHNAIIVVGDGKRALLLRNEGDAAVPHFVVERSCTDSNPPARAQGTDAPGRTFKRAGSTYRSRVETTDFHQLSKLRFARSIADLLKASTRSQPVPAIVLVAPARTLAELRQHLSAAAKQNVIAEIAKDLTKHPVADIERLLLTPHKAWDT